MSKVETTEDVISFWVEDLFTYVFVAGRNNVHYLCSIDSSHWQKCIIITLWVLHVRRESLIFFNSIVHNDYNKSCWRLGHPMIWHVIYSCKMYVTIKAFPFHPCLFIPPPFSLDLPGWRFQHYILLGGPLIAFVYVFMYGFMYVQYNQFLQ